MNNTQAHHPISKGLVQRKKEEKKKNKKMAASDDLDYLLPSNGPNPYYDTWDRHNSIAFSTATKGLHNAPGENNCFVNSAVQVFWHLDVFRRSYRRLSGHTCMGHSCIFCALKVIFTQFQYSDQTSLHPDALRKALAETFANQQRFQLGHMDDAAECFENILNRIHFHIAHNHPEDTCNALHCLPHQKFSLGIVEKVVCPCGASSKPLQFREMVHYISASALVSQAQLMQESGDVLHPDRFGLLLRNANAQGDIRQCPGGCGKSVQIRRTLLNSPDVVSIGLGWDSDHPSMEMTTKVARNIGTAILLQDVFHSVMQDVRSLPKLQLVGLVCYYGKHYSTFVFHSKLAVWIYFDDTTVKEIGPSFDHVVEKCTRGRYQPLLLLYANPNSTPVSVDTAPKKRVMAPGFHLPGSEDENSLDRTRDSISSQQSVLRAMTPNPDPPAQQVSTSFSSRARSVTPSSHDPTARKETASPMTAPDHSRQQSYMVAMSTTKADPKIRPPLRLGGQAGMPGPMTPVAEQDRPQEGSAFHRPEQDSSNYSDYTLSTSDQYRRPAMTGFTPADLPLTPNQKGHMDPQRKESFNKKEKSPLHADVIRYHTDPSKESVPGYGHQDLKTNMRGSAMFYQGPNSNPHLRQRSLSQGGDEAYASDSSEYSPSSQHTILKPTAGSQMGDGSDKRNSYTRTAVQSGLATLPRKKKSHGEVASSQISHDNQHFRPLSNPHYPAEDTSRHTPVSDSSGLPPFGPTRVMSPGVDQVDSMGKKLNSEAEKKLKKTKKDLKKTEKKKVRSYPNSSAVESALMARNAEESRVVSEAEMIGDKYINRKMVASVLKHQGLQRQPSTHSTNSQTSSSSLESEGIMGKLLAAKSHGDASFDSVSLGSHKDSGYGSSDRNSSSSTGSGTIDPAVQYFLSKSMVVPRNFNSQVFERQSQPFVTDFTAPTPQGFPGQHPGEGLDSEVSGEEKNRLGYQQMVQRKVMHPIKESSQEDMLKIMPKEVLEAAAAAAAANNITNNGSGNDPRSSPHPDAAQNKEGRAPPIPPKNFAAFQVSKSFHHREPSIDSLDKDEVKNDYFVSMCEKADDLMDRCILAETHENLSDALRYCDSALGCLKEAMNQTDIEKKAAIYAQKKHKSCLLKSRSLFKKVSHQNNPDGVPGKRSSITSTDSDNSDKMVRRAPSREQLAASNRTTPVPHQQRDVCNSSIDSGGSNRYSPMPGSQVPEGMQVKGDNITQYGLRYDSAKVVQAKENAAIKSHASRTQFVDPNGNHSRSGSNSSVRSSASVPTSLSQQVPTQGMHKSQSAIGGVAGGVAGGMAVAGPVPLDAYGTMCRQRKPRRTSDPSGNAEVYQLYLSKQKQLQADSGSDRLSTDSRESDSSSCEGNQQKKSSKAEIRELLENNIVQMQKQQLSPQFTGPTTPSARPPVRHPTAVYPAQSRNSPVPMHQDQAAAKTAVPSSVQARTHASSPLSHRHPTSPYPQAGQVKPHGAVRQDLTHPQQQQLVNATTPFQRSQPPASQHSHTHSYPATSQPPQTVSGYSQPLPGHRIPPPGMRHSNSYSQQPANPYPAQISNSSSCHPQTPSSCYPPSPSYPAYSNTSSQNLVTSPSSQAAHVSSVQNSNLTPDKNLVSQRSQPVASHDIRRSGGAQPPPPPTRTTSNPDFSVQLVQQPHNANMNSVLSHKHPASQSQPQQNIAFVQPNSHLPRQAGVATPPHSSHTQSPINPAPYRPGSVTDGVTYFASTSPVPGSQMKHAYSSTGLNTITAAAPPLRPLERCTSQPDCQSLSDSDSYAAPRDGSFYPPNNIINPLHHPSSCTPNPHTMVHVKSGPNMRLSRSSNTTRAPCGNESDDSDTCDRQRSVKDLLSRFDTPSAKPAVKPKPSALRTRSKSESGSKKPKSVLKSKKAKSGAGKSRKSVTFAQDFASKASGYESAAELTTFSASAAINDRAYFSDDEEHLGSRTFETYESSYHVSDLDTEDVEDSSNSDEAIPPEELACQLCRKREVELGKAYCSKCNYYMGRFSS